MLSPGRLAFCTAAVILVQRSFLQDLVLLKEDRRFWNSFCPEAVHINAWNKEIISKLVLGMFVLAFLAWRMMAVKSSYSAGVRWYSRWWIHW